MAWPPILKSLAASAGMLVAAAIPFLRGRRLRRLGVVLGEATDRDSGYASAGRREELVGAEGIAVTDLRPSGTGVFGDERVDVVSESEWIEKGSPIRILRSEGYRHVVRRI